MGTTEMRRLSKLTAVYAPLTAGGELPQHRVSQTSPPLPESYAPPAEKDRPVWHKDNHGFWLLACVMISVFFSVVLRALT